MAATRFLRRQVQKSLWVAAKDLQQDFQGFSCTVRCVLNAWQNSKTYSTPLLTQKHKKSQLQFAQNHINKPQKFWDSVLLSDERKLELIGPMDQRYVWRMKNEC